MIAIATPKTKKPAERDERAAGKMESAHAVYHTDRPTDTSDASCSEGAMMTREPGTFFCVNREAWRMLRTEDAFVLRVYLALATRADESGVCWPSGSRIADDAGINRATVFRAIRRLESLGLITTTPGGRRTSNTYQLGAPTPLPGDTMVGAPKPLPRRTHATTGRRTQATRVGAPVRPQLDPGMRLNELNSAMRAPTATPSQATGKKSTKGTKKKFRPPTVDEVRAYCLERGNTIDPETFVDYYISTGWRVGKGTMKDWRAAVRTWEKRQKNSGRHGDAGRSSPARTRHDDYSHIVGIEV